jgi:hypothetical protein
MAHLSSAHRDVTRSLNRSHGSFELALVPLLLALGGLWLDRTIGTVPVFTLVLAFVGIAGTFAKIFYSYRHSMSQFDADAAWVGHASTAEFSGRDGATHTDGGSA